MRDRRDHVTCPLVPRVWQLRETMTAYDATYLALAEALGEPGGALLLTTDARFARAVAATTSDVRMLLVS